MDCDVVVGSDVVEDCVVDCDIVVSCDVVNCNVVVGCDVVDCVVFGVRSGVEVLLGVDAVLRVISEKTMFYTRFPDKRFIHYFHR